MNNRINLQEPQSSGGEIAEAGFEFQNNIILSFIPKWLKDSSFDSFVREAMGDFEIKFFRPNNGYIFDFVEVKDHSITPSEFWGEVKRFRKMDQESSGMYRYFILASTGTSSGISPITNSLRRIKGPYSFYGPSSKIIKNSLKAFRRRVVKDGHSEEDADFLFNKVIIKDDFSASSGQGEAIFIQALSVCFLEFDRLPYSVNQTVFSSLKNFVGTKPNELIGRKEIENKIRNCVDQKLLTSPIIPTIFTSIDDNKEDNSVNLKWLEFWGGDNREFPHPDIWNEKMLWHLKNTRGWISDNFNIRRMALTGNRRLSSAIAIGTEFSATSGFNIDFNFRGDNWATDQHATKDTPDYELQSKVENTGGENIAVSIGIVHNIEEEVKTYLNNNSLANISNVSILGEDPIISPEQTNVVVQKVKKLINTVVSETGATKIHLFFAGPSFLALFLGHRLNATADIQCYERVSPNKYVPTCLLKCR